MAQNSSSRHAQPVNGALAMARATTAGEPPARPGALPAGLAASAGFTGPVAPMIRLSSLCPFGGDP